MDESYSQDTLAPHDTGGIRRGISWILSGQKLVREQEPLWYGMAAMYLVLGFLIKMIPIMGELLLILITPLLLAGIVWGRAQENPADRAAAYGHPASLARTLFRSWIARPAQELTRIVSREEERAWEGAPADQKTGKLFGVALLCIVTLGLAILVMIPRELLVGGPMMSRLAATEFGYLYISTLFSMLLIAVLYVGLAMGLLYSVPLTVLGNRQPLAAIAESFSACRRNAVPLLTLVAPFFVIYILIMAAFTRDHWLGYLLVFSAGLAALPVFIASLYSSYLSLFPGGDPDPRL